MASYRILPILLLSAGALSGCSAGLANYPSLAQRPIERAAQIAPPAEGAPALPAAPALPPQIEAIVATARNAGADVKARLAETRPTIEKGRAATPGSEAWVAAQEAYSNVDTARAPIGGALADLDKMHREAVDAGDLDRQTAIENAVQQVQAIDAEARTTLEPLQPAGG